MGGGEYGGKGLSSITLDGVRRKYENGLRSTVPEGRAF
jgi:hypothetical protein